MSCQIEEACPEVAKAAARQMAKAAEVAKAAARKCLRSIQRLHTRLDFSTVFESSGTHLAKRHPVKYCFSRCRPYRKPASPAAIQRSSQERDLTAPVDEFTGPAAQLEAAQGIFRVRKLAAGLPFSLAHTAMRVRDDGRRPGWMI